MKEKIDKSIPRLLRYRSHYSIYQFLTKLWFGFFALLWLCLFLWNIKDFWIIYSNEFLISSAFSIVMALVQLFWIAPKLKKYVQVFEDYILIYDGKRNLQIWYRDLESVQIVGWSLFYLRLQNGDKFYFSSSLERVDYVWDGIKNARPELISDIDYSQFRLKLIQYDHHQKRKAAFFKYKFINFLNWVILPLGFVIICFVVQAKFIEINSTSQYFIRLSLYAALAVLMSSVLFSIILKKFLFDKKIKDQVEINPGNKLRDTNFEDLIFQRSRIVQLITVVAFYGMILKFDLNFFSMTKLKQGWSQFQLKTGKTAIVDNRYNCLKCYYQLVEGDVVMFSKGHIGQILAVQGEEIAHSSVSKGRSIASDSIYKIPERHLAVRLDEAGKSVVIIKETDVIGKIRF